MARVRLVHRRNPNVVVVVDEERADRLALMGYSPEKAKPAAKKAQKSDK